MIKADTLLQIVGVTAIAALGIPVALSVKYRDGSILAAEIRDAIGTLVWKTDISAPTRFTSVEASLKLSKGQNAHTIATLAVPYEKGVKSASISVFVDDTSARLWCSGQHSEGALPFAASSTELKSFGLGGKGKETDANTFLLLKNGEYSLSLVIDVN